MKISQVNFVKQQLKEDGYISRNRCLRQHITRLGAIISILIDDGYKFINWSKTGKCNFWGRKEDVGYGKNDFVYTLLKVNKKNK